MLCAVFCCMATAAVTRRPQEARRHRIHTATITDANAASERESGGMQSNSWIVQRAGNHALHVCACRLLQRWATWHSSWDSVICLRARGSLKYDAQA